MHYTWLVMLEKVRKRPHLLTALRCSTKWSSTANILSQYLKTLARFDLLNLEDEECTLQTKIYNDKIEKSFEKYYLLGKVKCDLHNYSHQLMYGPY